MRRVSIIGISGAGKTTLARELARRLGVPHLELDSVMHQPGWQELDREIFQLRVKTFASAERWVIDGNYTSHGISDLVWARADTIVWIDLPRWLVMLQLVPRSLRRVVTREELWNGNRERLSGLFDRRPEKNMMLWAWTRHAVVRSRYEGHMRNDRWAAHRVFRLRSRREVSRFIEQLPRNAAGA